MDEEALAQARAAAYTPREMQSVPPDLLEKYFEPEGGRYVFHKDLRRALIFGRHDLLQDAPISRIDLLVCRNTLMYFNAEVQAQIWPGSTSPSATAAFCFWAKPRCCSPTPACSCRWT